MTIIQKKLKTIEDFESLKWGDWIGIEFKDEMRVRRVANPAFVFGYLCLENEIQRFNYKKLVEGKSDFAEVALLTSSRKDNSVGFPNGFKITSDGYDELFNELRDQPERYACDASKDKVAKITFKQHQDGRILIISDDFEKKE